MVCPRCIKSVRDVFKELNINIVYIQLGKVESNSKINDTVRTELNLLLVKRGFEVLESKNHKTNEQIKTIIIEQVHFSKELLNTNFSVYISGKLNQEYTSLSKLFSSVEGITIERFILKQKIEHIKELLFYKEYTLSEIAFQMGYSSVAYLSSLFKKETGMSPTEFKKLKSPNHQPLDAL